MNHPIRTTTDLIRAAAECLIARDTDGIDRLQRISSNWMQGRDEADAQMVLLTAIFEAAELLEGEPSAHEHLIRDEDEDSED